MRHPVAGNKAKALKFNLFLAKVGRREPRLLNPPTSTTTRGRSMRLVSAMFMASLALGAALATPAQANNCKFPCFGESSGSASGRHGGSGAVAHASRYLGTNPTKRSRLWCAEFMNMMERKMGRPGTGSAKPSFFASYAGG